MYFKVNSDFLIITLSQIVQLIIGYLILSFVVNKLNARDFSLYSIAFTVILFARHVFYDSFSVVISKKISRKKTYILVSNTYKNLLFLYFLILLLVLTVINFFIYLFNFYIDIIYMEWIILCSIYLSAYGILGVNINVLNLTFYRKQAAIFSMVEVFLKLIIIIIFLNYIDNDIENIFLYLSLGTFVVLFFTFSEILPSFKFKNIFGKKHIILLKIIFIRSIPFLVPSIIVGLKIYIDKWIFSTTLTVDDLATYLLYFQLGVVPVTILVGVIQTYIAPIIYKESCNLINLFRLISKTLLLLLVLALFFTIFVDFISYYFVDFMSNNFYSIYSSYLYLFVISGFLIAFCSILYVCFISLVSNFSLFYFSILTLLFNVLILYIFTIDSDFTGSVYGLLYSSIFSFLAHLSYFLYLTLSKLQTYTNA